MAGQGELERYFDDCAFITDRKTYVNYSQKRFEGGNGQGDGGTQQDHDEEGQEGR